MTPSPTVPARRAIACAVAILAAACSRGAPVGGGTPSPAASPPASPTQEASPAPPPSPSPAAPRLGEAAVRLTRIASLGQPLAMAMAEGDDALYVAEKGGRVRAIRGGQVDPSAVLDVSRDVSGGGERGLLGLAFSPGFIYVNFTNRGGDTRVREYAFRDGRADPATAREVLAVDQPFSNHNGGNLVFGPDGALWIGLGDGGSGGDPQDNGQSLDTLLGKMLRINPRPQGNQPYGEPTDNPLVGTPGARPEIWAFGLRNPWRYSFDRETGDLWIGDVGQSAREEINFQPASSRGGENYGWNRFEGTQRFRGDLPQNHTPPIFDYRLGGGNCAVTGGYVYRGTKIPALRGAYLFADFCAGAIRALVQEGGRVVDERSLGPEVSQLASFGEDRSGELYALSLDGGVFRIDPGS